MSSNTRAQPNASRDSALAVTNSPRPIAPRVIPSNIPAELRVRQQWITWRCELRDVERWTKVPYTHASRADELRHASSTDPQT